MIFFTSDQHFYHKNIIKYCNRPFSSVEEMNQTLIQRWNEKVKKEDTVYILGDFTFKNWSVLLEQLSGIKILILGSHDKNYESALNYFKFITSLYELHLNELSITLCHYPMRSWPKSHFNSWMLHGHHHKDISNLTPGKILNVCVDLHEFYPISLEEVKSYMATRDNNWDFVVTA